MPEFDLSQWLTAGIIVNLMILAYAYILFPLMMVLTGLRRRPGLLRPDTQPAVTLIIPAHNEESVIAQKIENSLALDYPNLEIIVASDGSTDRTVEIAGGYARIALLDFENRRGKSSIVNDSVARANGEIICLCDANVMLHPDALWRLAAHFADETVGGVTGDVRLQSCLSSFGFAEALYYRIERNIQLGESNLGAVMGVDGGMYVVRRELFCNLAPDTILDDFTVAMNVLRSGKNLLYEPTAIADESATELAMDEYRRRVRIGVGAAQVLGRGVFPRLTQPIRLFLFVSHKFLRWISPWLLISLLIFAVALSIFRPIALAVVIPSFLILGLAAIGAIWPRARKSGLVSISFYFTLSQIAFAWGTLRGLFFETSGTWQRTTRQKLVDEKNA